jgi:hypothetical protein
MTPPVDQWAMFLWGVGGSVAVEVVTMWDVGTKRGHNRRC